MAKRVPQLIRIDGDAVHRQDRGECHQPVVHTTTLSARFFAPESHSDDRLFPNSSANLGEPQGSAMTIFHNFNPLWIYHDRDTGQVDISDAMRS
jgi:hypothetical protein